VGKTVTQLHDDAITWMGANGATIVNSTQVLAMACPSTTTAKKTTAKKTTAGKVTFKTTRSKKDAGKVTKKETTTTITTTTNNLPKVDAHKIEGSLTMTVPDADKAIKDAKFIQAVTDGIAAASKCPAKYITLKLTKARRLSTNVRNLAVVTKTLKVAYTMTIPAKNPTKTASDKVLADMKALKVADLTKSIQTKVTAAKGKDYTITVSSKTAATRTKIKIDAPTTAAPAISSAMNGGVHSILIVASVLTLTLFF